MRSLVAFAVMTLALACVAPTRAADGLVQELSSDRKVSPKNWVSGFVDFAVAPPHNEPDLGLCPPRPGPLVPGEQTCGAYARYSWGGYVEFQPFGRTMLKHLFLFGTPKLWGGNNVPQLQYNASASGILWEQTLGAGVTLPHRLELRATNHRNDRLGRYAGPLNPLVANPNGPYGIYTTVGVRWYFGGYGRQGGSY